MSFLDAELCVLTIMLSLAGCATTGAYVQTHPSAADEVEIAASAFGCVDQAAASVVLETSWQSVLVNALACVSGLVSNQLMDAKLEAPTREAVHREVIIRQDRNLKRYRALPKSDSKELSREAVPTDLSDPLPNPYPDPKAPIEYTWEERIAVPQEDSYCGH